MVTLDWCVESREGVSLVELTVENPTDCARRVRVGNRLDGVVWPPRREGVPVAGWDDGGFEGVLAPGERRAFGYASPAQPAEPPVELVWTERAGESERSGAEAFVDGATGDHCDLSSDDATPEGVVRSLGDPRPPADAVPRPTPEADSTSPIPRPVESWLSAVAERRADSSLTSEDRSALAAVARRIEELRGAGDSRESEPTEAASSAPRARRSP
jgi:hypothetical protein